ncbi:hypothetical protein O6H91_Y068500 [Diphasiastrum complanatum]|nr:hypothetical protein O6H91_Y537400 [Diphasiastrum complanatum]KAJ7224862.1 hypothetical protein O6H91_Y464400 [Diphasiastrum complanatum]KAJ7295934.1 hypothetical protein O6H91_Y154700 [Diphasiastrum complanatum]KAJ7298012.1 hypothetical protein O6H91_Y021900 [Diphasiastrum complanatum]KAJ7300121.1 hypothetical protein O6H91_Y068500 [Diphasiastrum complanatum]
MATEDVKLLSSWYSPYAMRAILALEAKGVKYELIDEDLNTKSQLLLESNPVYKKIPVLIHNGKAIPESLVIVLYADEAWPEDGSRSGFFPKDPYGRATTRFWSDFADKKILDAALYASNAKGEEKESALRELYDNFMTLESGFTKVAAKPFFNGSTMGYADICLAPLVVWLPVLVQLGGIRVPKVEEAPHLHKFFSAICEHPAAKVALPDPEKLIVFVETMRQRRRAASASQP